MKTQSLTMGLAFLVAAFMWGCQEQASSPVGPEGLGPQFDQPSPTNPNCAVPDAKGHCHGGGDNPEGPDVDVTLMGGIMTPEPQPATLSSDGGRVSAFKRGFFATLGLTAPDDLGVCQPENTTTGLADYLTKVLGEPENRLNEDGEFTIAFQFFVQRKKGSGLFTVNWRQPTDDDVDPPELDPGRNIRVQVSSDNVVSVDQNVDQTKFTFHFHPSGVGEVSVRRSALDGEPVNSRDLLTCPYLGPDLVIILDRSPLVD